MKTREAARWAVPLGLAIAFPLVIDDPFLHRLAAVAVLQAVLAVSLNLVLGYGGLIALGHMGFYAIGAYATALLDTPLPWTRMRQVYALVGLVKRWGAERVDAACARAIDAEAVSGVKLIGRMLERATERERTAEPTPSAVPPGRFARDPGHFAVAPQLPLDGAVGASA